MIDLIRPMSLLPYFFVSAITVFLSLVTAYSAENPTQAVARALMQNVEARFVDLKSIRYTAKRTLKGTAGSATEAWTFAYAEPGMFRIECRQPVERILVADPTTFWEYIPALRKVMKTETSTMPEDARRQLLASILARVAVDGIRIGTVDDLARRAVSVSRASATGGVVRIEGARPRYVVELDEDRRVLRKIEMYDDQDACLLRTSAADFVEIQPGLWYPSEVRLECKTDRGLVSSVVELRSIEANKPFPIGSFTFNPPRGVTVETAKRQVK